MSGTAWLPWMYGFIEETVNYEISSLLGIKMNIQKLLIIVKSQGDVEKAEQHKNYHKSEREHWGLTVPQCDQLAKEFTKGMSENEKIALAEALWKTDQFDAMVIAIKILSSKSIKPSKELWKLLNECLTVVDGWALEDGLAHVAWKCIHADEELLHELEKWTKHSDFWMRRAVLIYTLPYAKKGKNPERMLQWAAGYVNDTEWFIQKAIGWWLRVLGEHNPERVIVFLKQHWKSLKSVARKEATRKLPAEYAKVVKLFS